MYSPHTHFASSPHPLLHSCLSSVFVQSQKYDEDSVAVMLVFGKHICRFVSQWRFRWC